MNRRINLVFLIIIGSLLSEPFKIEKYFKNGQVKEEINYKDNKREGLEIFYFENGKIRRENLYRNNKLVK